MSGVQPFQFEPTFPPGEEPTDSEESEEDDTEVNLSARIGNTEWCSCGRNCVAMLTDHESFCCQELEELNQKFDESGVDCITEHVKFRIVCLDTDVLNMALVAIHNVRCNPVLNPIENRTWRLAAYRQFTWWVHGVLGKKKWPVIPAYVVNAVQNEFPEEGGHYVGFQEAELDLN